MALLILCSRIATYKTKSKAKQNQTPLFNAPINYGRCLLYKLDNIVKILNIKKTLLKIIIKNIVKYFVKLHTNLVIFFNFIEDILYFRCISCPANRPVILFLCYPFHQLLNYFTTTKRQR